MMIMEIKSILIKDTTKEERIRIVQEGLNQCGGACDFCNGCDNLGGGAVDAFYEPYINGEKEYIIFLQVHTFSMSNFLRLKKTQHAAKFILYSWDALSQKIDYKDW